MSEKDSEYAPLGCLFKMTLIASLLTSAGIILAQQIGKQRPTANIFAAIIQRNRDHPGLVLRDMEGGTELTIARPKPGAFAWISPYDMLVRTEGTDKITQFNWRTLQRSDYSGIIPAADTDETLTYSVFSQGPDFSLFQQGKRIADFPGRLTDISWKDENFLAIYDGMDQLQHLGFYSKEGRKISEYNGTLGKSIQRPAWSADGTRASFLEFDFVAGLWKLKQVSVSDAVVSDIRIPGFTVAPATPSWGAGDKLAVLVNSGTSVYTKAGVVDLNANTFTLLQPNRGSDEYEQSISADGKYVAFIQQDGAEIDLVVTDTNGVVQQRYPYNFQGNFSFRPR